MQSSSENKLQPCPSPPKEILSSRLNGENGLEKPDGKSPSAQTPPPAKSILWSQILAGVAAAITQLSIGGVISYAGVALPMLTDEQSDDIILNQNQVSIFGSIVNIGTLFGCLLSGVIMTWIGQRRSMIYFLPVGVLGWIILALSPSFGVLVLARLILGFTVGTVTADSYNYIVEIAHTSIRGRLIAMLDLFRQIGFTLTVAIGTSDLSWRNQAFIQICAYVVPFIILFFLPDSPRWLSTKKRHDDARKSLVFYRGSKYDVSKELEEIFAQVESQKKKISVWNQAKLIISKDVLPIFILTCFLMLFLHFGGNASSVTYSVSIFDSAQVPYDSYLSTTISSSFRVVGALTYILCSGRFNNKTLYWLPLVLSGASMIVLGLFFYLQHGHDLSSVNWLPLLSISSFSYWTSVYYPASMLARAELLPNSVRPLASGLHFSLVSVSMFVSTYSFPYMVQGLGSHWTYWCYGVCSFIVATVVWMFVPETKGKTLEQISEMRLRKVSRSKHEA